MKSKSTVEIERKFLVSGAPWEASFVAKLDIVQGYLNVNPTSTVRIRKESSNVLESAYITIKGLQRGFSRREFEYSISVDDADIMLSAMCEFSITKTRYIIEHIGHEWHVDEFKGNNTGLVTAEIELASETENFELPYWVKDEITFDPRYANSNLAVNPYCFW